MFILQVTAVWTPVGSLLSNNVLNSFTWRCICRISKINKPTDANNDCQEFTLFHLSGEIFHFTLRTVIAFIYCFHGEHIAVRKSKCSPLQCYQNKRFSIACVTRLVYIANEQNNDCLRQPKENENENDPLHKNNKTIKINLE